MGPSWEPGEPAAHPSASPPGRGSDPAFPRPEPQGPGRPVEPAPRGAGGDRHEGDGGCRRCVNGPAHASLSSCPVCAVALAGPLPPPVPRRGMLSLVCGPLAPRALQADLSGQRCPQSVGSPQVNVALMLSGWLAVSARRYPEFSGGAGDHRVA